ncbi:MAG: glycosyltransferase [Bacteroidales bacterium]|nr:glycosyltransferase [Bacteroidales bacterium]
MKFSVVIPIYNVESYLEQCLESLQSQDYKDYEVICVNDGSTDHSREILTVWESRIPQMRIIDRENGGLSAARNTGLKAAAGDFVVFVDSDDWVEPTMLSTLAATTGNEEMVCFACQRTDNKATDSLPREQTSGWDYYNHHALEARVVPFVCVWQRCYRRQFLLDNNLWFREGILHEDNEFTPRACLKANSVTIIPDTLYHYRVRPNSIMTTRGLRSKESLITIGNELSELFGNENNIDKTFIYQALTQCYQMAFINNTREEDRQLRLLIDWKAYHRVSRTKLRHRINYLLIRKLPAWYHQAYNNASKQ